MLDNRADLTAAQLVDWKILGQRYERKQRNSH
jgi:hypothetical protein